MDDRELLTTWRAAFATPVVGWDFSDLPGLQAPDPPWSYAEWAARALAGSTSALDLGTGGGEVLLDLASTVGLPRDTVATEGWPPNLPVARAALAGLGIDVAAYDAEDDPQLPFPDARFGTVLNRHEAYDAAEVARVLRADGRFLTQQVDGRSLAGLSRLLGGGDGAYAHVTLANLAAEAAAAGLVPEDWADWTGVLRFADVTTLVGYARMVPWDLPDDFTIDRYADRLLALHHSGREPAFEQGRFVLLARAS